MVVLQKLMIYLAFLRWMPQTDSMVTDQKGSDDAKSQTCAD